MRKIITLGLLLLGLGHAYGQSKEVHTLLSNRTRVGAYVSLENQVKDFTGTGAGMYSGARAGLIFNRRFFVGVGAYGLSSGLGITNLLDDAQNYHLTSGYGGLSIEPILFSRQTVHFSFPLLAGVGIAELSEVARDGSRFLDDDLFAVYQGGANIELNVTKWMRVSGGVYYTQTDDFLLRGVRHDLMDGLSYGLSLKLGRF